jgi:hypothetical protein
MRFNNFKPRLRENAYEIHVPQAVYIMQRGIVLTPLLGGVL